MWRSLVARSVHEPGVGSLVTGVQGVRGMWWHVVKAMFLLALLLAPAIMSSDRGMARQPPALPVANHRLGATLWGSAIEVPGATTTGSGGVIAVGASGLVHVAWSNCCVAPISYSRWDGILWSTPITFPVPGADSEDAAAISTHEDNVHLVFHARTGVSAGLYDIFYTQWDGTSWSYTTKISDPLGGHWPDIAVDTQGRAHVVWQSSWQGIQYTRYDGVSWSTPITLTNPGSSASAPAIAIDGMNRVHVVWSQDMPEYPSDIFYTAWDGAQWSVPMNLSNTPGYSTSPDIAADRLGNVYVVWTNDRTTSDGVIFRTWDGFSWSTPQVVRALGLQPAVAAGDYGAAHLVWAEWAALATNIYHSGKRGTLWSQPTNLSNVVWCTVVCPLRPTITVGPIGDVHVLWNKGYNLYYIRLAEYRTYFPAIAKDSLLP